MTNSHEGHSDHLSHKNPEEIDVEHYSNKVRENKGILPISYTPTVPNNPMELRLNKLALENKELKLAASNKIRAGPEPSVVYESKMCKDLIREKNEIEEILRGEILLNEEQRSQIGVLREALEAKIEDLGLKELLMSLSGKDQGVDELFTKLILMKKEIEEERNQFNIEKENIFEIEGLITDLSKQIEEQKNQLMLSNDECCKLSEEKEEATKVLEELTKEVLILYNSSTNHYVKTMNC